MFIEPEDPAPLALRNRLRPLFVVLALAFLILLGRLWQLQVMRGRTYLARTVSNVVHERFLPAVRGRITDRNGVPLAENRAAFTIYAAKEAINDAHFSQLVALLSLSTDEASGLRRRLDEAPPRARIALLDDVNRDRASLLQQHRFELPGIEVTYATRRSYPKGELAAHLLGYLAAPTEADLAKWKETGVTSESLVGRAGIEYTWEDQLHGHPGRERFAVDARGKRLSPDVVDGLIAGARVTEPVPGSTIVLTIDADLQAAAEKAIARYAAAAVVIVDVQTGDLLTVASRPTFEPNIMSNAPSRDAYAALADDPRRPFLNKATRVTFPPGSVFKFVTAAAALENKMASPSETFTCHGGYELSGRRFRCTAAHGKLDMEGAFQHSCNVYFWELAARVGLDEISKTANEFGFGISPNTGLGGDASGRIPTRAWYEERGAYVAGYATNAATGQGDVEVSVLQVALAYAAIAADGRVMVPQIVRRVDGADGEAVLTFEPRVAHQAMISPATLAILRRGLWATVNKPGGTAYGTATSNVVGIGGKTGTAEVRRTTSDDTGLPGWDRNTSHAWFAGYAPFDNPKIAIAVLVEHGGPGGRIAAPVAKQIIEAWAAGRRQPP